ncbi:hypothetical protein [uncultured Streptomyces sp.]|uniref:hypothetical protein n=1 Tax=uncultured Streptomyces sp. TaxID=174707 RepID=UPI0026368BD2|nr:hypothetical protein [uncultured Streptomyces sp.]
MTAAAGLVVALGAGLVACGSEDTAGKEDGATAYVGADEVCGGLFEGALAKKLETVTGTTEFFDKGDGTDKVVEALTRGYESGHRSAAGGDLCEFSRKGGRPRDAADITFSMYAPQDLEDPSTAPGTQAYTMGKRSEARGAGASIYLACVSPELKGSSTDPLRVYGSFTNKSDAADTPEIRAANLEILHAGALSVVKELGCEGAAGLPETPVLTPK